ncbi:MAG: hypothetical protein ACPG5B_09520 [Chitinophagales bacterium]
MKKQLLLLICFLVFSHLTLYAQNIPLKRGVVAKSLPAPFEPNTQQLQLFLNHLESLLTCEETFDRKEADCFFTETDIKGYINYLMSKNYPQIRQEATPLFLGMTKEAKVYVKSLLENSISHIELHGTKQRYGTTEAMKVVMPYINVFYHDGQARTIRLNLMEYNNAYKIMNINY